MNIWKCSSCSKSDPCILQLKEYEIPKICPFGAFCKVKWVENKKIVKKTKVKGK